MIRLIILLTIITAAFFAGIGPKIKELTWPAVDPGQAQTDNATPKVEPLARYGNSDYEQNGVFYKVKRSALGFRQQGTASWYGPKFHGRRTSSGEVYDMYQMTAAHPTLPLPSYVKVTNLANQKSVVVKVNDRGPFVKNRVIDLSYAAALKIDMIETGTTPVAVEVLNAQGRPAQQRLFAEQKPQTSSLEYRTVQPRRTGEEASLPVFKGVMMYSDREKALESMTAQ